MEVHRCPTCARLAHRSRSRTLLESIVKLVAPVKIYRCSECGWRGYVWTGFRQRLWGPRRRPQRASVMLLAVVALTAVLVSVFHARIMSFLSPQHDEATAEPPWEEPPGDEEASTEEQLPP